MLVNIESMAEDLYNKRVLGGQNVARAIQFA
jgi:hypothetical protein